MLCGFDDYLAKQATATSNRIRGMLTQVHQALERVVGKHLDHPATSELLVKYPTPKKLRKAAPRAGKSWAAEVFTALGEQSVVVAGTNAVGIVLPQLSAMLKQLRALPLPKIPKFNRIQQPASPQTRSVDQGLDQYRSVKCFAGMVGAWLVLVG